MNVSTLELREALRTLKPVLKFSQLERMCEISKHDLSKFSLGGTLKTEHKENLYHALNDIALKINSMTIVLVNN